MWRVDLEVDGLSVDTLVGARHAGGLVLDLALNIAKVCELAAGNVVKLGPLVASRGMRRFVGVG